MILDPCISPSYSLILRFSNLAEAIVHCPPFPKVPKCWGHHLFFFFWLRWVFVSVRGLSLVAVSAGHSSSRCVGLSLSRPLLLRSTGSRRAGSVVVAHGPSCSAACGIIPDQGSNPCPLHWQADSQPLRHQGSPGSSSYFAHADVSTWSAFPHWITWETCTCLLSLMYEFFLIHPFFPGSPVHLFLLAPNHTTIIIIYLSPLLDFEIIKYISFSIYFWKPRVEHTCLAHQRHSVCYHYYSVCLTNGLEY